MKKNVKKMIVVKNAILIILYTLNLIKMEIHQMKKKKDKKNILNFMKLKNQKNVII